MRVLFSILALCLRSWFDRWSLNFKLLIKLLERSKFFDFLINYKVEFLGLWVTIFNFMAMLCAGSVASVVILVS